MVPTLSLLGMLQISPDLISSTNFPLPTGLQHETLDPLLLAETAELEILYPEPTTLATVIKAWATARGLAWGRMQAALAAEYNPIHNYDRSEEWTEEREGENNRQGSSDRGNSSTTTGSDSASLTSDRAGYNSAAANAPSSKDVSSGSSTTTVTGTQDDSWEEAGTNAENSSRSGHVSGNIGVTTSQQMIEAELELRRLDIYRLIVQEFKTMFCLGVY